MNVPAPVELREQVHEFRVFTGGVESDPHRVAFWRATLTIAGIRLALDEVPAGEEEAAEVTWAELHQVLGNRLELMRDQETLKEDIAQLERELADLRCERRRLAQLNIALLRQQGVLGGHRPAALPDGSIVAIPNQQRISNVAGNAEGARLGAPSEVTQSHSLTR